MLASNLELVRHILTETAFIIEYTDKKTKDQVHIILQYLSFCVWLF